MRDDLLAAFRAGFRAASEHAPWMDGMRGLHWAETDAEAWDRITAEEFDARVKQEDAQPDAADENERLRALLLDAYGAIKRLRDNDHHAEYERLVSAIAPHLNLPTFEDVRGILGPSYRLGLVHYWRTTGDE